MEKIIFTACILVAATLNAQNYEWAKSFRGSNDDIAKSITTDALGNVYTTGDFQGTVDFDPGVGTANLTSLGGYDIFVQKMDASGNFLWAKRFGGTSYDIAYSIKTDALGNVYTTGFFQGTVDFDPNTGITNLTSGGNNNSFIQKMDASGNFLWAKSLEGASNRGHSINIDTSGYIYTTGFFQGTVDFNPGSGIANLTTIAGSTDIFVLKMDTFGNFLWAKSFGGTYQEVGYSICVDTLGNVYTTGPFNDTVDFDPGTGIANLTTIAGGGPDIFVQKMDASGNFLWAKSFGGANYDESRSISIDASGNIYTTGVFQQTVDFDPGVGISNLTSEGAYDIFVQKMDSSGNFLWAKSFGGINVDLCYSISVDTLGNVYTTGSFNETVDFDPGAATANLTSAGVNDIFVHKMDTSGEFLWAKSFGAASNDTGRSISTDTSGNVYITGDFKGTVDFDPGAGTANLTSAATSLDIYVLKMNQTTLGINEIDNVIQLIAYPNPTSGDVVLKLQQITDDVELILSDIQGKVINKQKYGTLLNVNIKLPNQKSIYFLTVKTSNGQSILKLIKE